MPFELVPQNALLYPNDQQLYIARLIDRLPLWRVDQGYLQPDFSVRNNPVNSSGLNATGANLLATGFGSIEYVLTGNCVPQSGLLINLNAWFKKPGASPWLYQVQINGTGGNILVKDELGATLATISITPVAGMKIRIEYISGFRVFIDGVLQHTRTLGSTISYPGMYSVTTSGNAALVAVPPCTVPAPKLEGDWQLADVDLLTGVQILSFLTPPIGSFTALGDLRQKMFGGATTPGQYTLSTRIEPGRNVWMDDAVPTGGTQQTENGDAWTFVSSNPLPIRGTLCHKSNNVVGDHRHYFTGATATLPVLKDDVMYCWVFPDNTNTPTEIMLEWIATDATGIAHRAYWGANSLAQGTDGTPSRRFMGSMPPANQWTLLEVPASLLDLEGRVINGMSFRLFGGVCSFDEAGTYPGKIQNAFSTLFIPPLQILGDLIRTIQPSAKMRPQTNYDNAQNVLVTLSVLGGLGTISQGEFVAPSAPGPNVLRASASVGNQAADMTLNVPPVITPNFYAAGPSETINWLTNIRPMPDFVGAGTMSEGTFDNAPGLPAGILPNDILLLFVQTANQAVSTPSGWAPVADSPQGTGTGGAAGSARISAFWKRVVLGEVAPTVSDPGDHAISQILAFRNCIETGNPWDVTSGDVQAVTNTAVSIPGDTTTVANCLVVLAVAQGTDTATPQVSGFTNSDLVNLTERTDVSTASGVGGGFAIATGEKAAAGAYQATTATLATTSLQGRMSIALKPATIVWTASAGSINSSSGQWTAPSVVGQTVKITVTNNTWTVTRDVLVLDKFPFNDPASPVAVEHQKNVLISEAEDGSFVTRVKDKDGKSRQAREVSFRNKELSELETALAFWERCHPGIRFIFEDKLRNNRIICRFDSNIRWEADASCAIDIAFRIKEVFFP